jgi:hypothetical protein
VSTYICEKCGCIDNTALGFYWTKNSKSMWPEEVVGKALCCECGPTHYKDGGLTEFGTWHNRFRKKHWSECGTKEEIIKESQKDIGNVVNAEEYFRKYGDA